MKIDTTKTHKLVNELAANNPMFSSLAVEIHAWVDIKARTTEKKYLEVCNKIQHCVGKESGISDVTPSNIEREIQAVFDKNVSSILKRVGKSYEKAANASDCSEMLGQIVLVRPHPQKAKARHFCKVVGVNSGEFFDKQREEAKRALSETKWDSNSWWKQNPVYVYTNHKFAGNILVSMSVEVQSEKVSVENFIPKLNVVPVVCEDGGASEVKRGNYCVSSTVVELSSVDALLGAFMQNVAEIRV
jgi:hypothetical protein